MNAPLVAVVTPVYNGGRWLAETMATVQCQTYANLVHIVLDNASADETPDIIARFHGGAVPIVASRNANTLPLCANWEAAVRKVPAEAEYFRVLCADDLMLPSAIEKLVSVAEADPSIDLVGSLVGEGGTPDAPERVGCKGLPEDRTTFDGRWALKTYFMHLHEAASPTHALMRRRCLMAEERFYDKRYLSFDLDVYLRIMLHARYGFVHEPLGWTRLHGESISSTLRTDQIFATEWLDYVERYGALTMTEREFALCRRAILRHHFRRMLLWQTRRGAKEKYDAHRAFLAVRGALPGVKDYAAALAEWAWLAARNRRHMIGATPSLWQNAMAELRVDDAPSHRGDGQTAESASTGAEYTASGALSAQSAVK